MDLLFLGTSSGTPTKQRNVTGLALQEDSGSAWYLVDCGEGTQHQLLHTALSTNDLQAIFITHVHGDHCYGLPGLLASAGMSGRKQPLQIIAPAGIEAWLKATLQLTQLFLPFPLQFIATETLERWTNGKLQVDAVALSHRVPSFAYGFTEVGLTPSLNAEKLEAEGIPAGPIWGQLRKGQDATHNGRSLKSADYVYFPNKPRRIVVGGDNDQPNLLTETCCGAQVLVHEATFTKDIAAKVGDVGHSSAAAVAAFAESTGLPNLLLTHFSARYQADAARSPSIEDIRSEAREIYQGQLFLAEDFARYRLDKGGRLSLLSQTFTTNIPSSSATAKRRCD